MRTTIKTTSELNNGDTVMHYGVPFVISNKRESAFHKDIGFGKVYVFDTQELPNDKSDDCFPLHWRTDYKIQGNDIATWAVNEGESVA